MLEREAIGHIRALVRKPGCPICRGLAEAMNRSTFWFLYEGYYEEVSMSQLCAADGFCPSHFWALTRHSGTWALSYIPQYLIEDALERLRAARRSGWRKLAPAWDDCPTCSRLAWWEEYLVMRFVIAWPVPEIRAAYEVLDPLPRSVELVSEGHHKAFSLGPGQTAQWTYVLRCLRRSQFTLGHLHVRLHGRAGLLIRETQYLAPKPCAVYPQVIPLRRAVRPPHTQVYAGNYVSSALGEGIEFGNIRPFAPGDRTKRINWRASPRLHDLYVNEYQQERNADVIVMLDTLTSVGSPALNTLDLCVRAAASIAWAYVRRKDRVGLIAYGGAFRWVRPGVERAHFQAILNHLLEAEVMFSYVAKDLALVPNTALLKPS